MENPSPRRAPALSRAPILVAEDDPEMRRLLTHSLRRRGHLVDEAVDGSSLLERLRARPLPSLLITDLRMPWIDGLEAVRLAGASRWVPTLLVTAFPDPMACARASRAGVEVLAKPVDMEVLCNRVMELLIEADPFHEDGAHDGYGPIRRR